MIVGREQELELLRSLKDKSAASIVVVQGRRRIGKSFLIKEFAKEFKHFYDFQGLAPRAGITPTTQRASFASQFAKVFKVPTPTFESWYEALSNLAERCKEGRTLILLDEISWMSSNERDFAGTLKIVWDTMFSRNPKLVLALCGSVASWIEYNILSDADFVGRISQVIRLKELSLASSAKMLGGRFGAIDKLQLLAVTGGVPKYLEEINPKQSVDENIRRLCFSPGGYLYVDFDRIFSDIFGRRSENYKGIVRELINNRLSLKSLASKLRKPCSGELTRNIRDLELAGFIARDFNTSLTTSKKAGISLLRISDNYLRFYLKYIQPNAERIERGIFSFQSLRRLIAWDTILGLQFENLIANRAPEIIKHLGIEHEQILAAGPYYQPHNKRQSAVQVDLLIHCKPRILFLCEIKFRNKIITSVIEESKQKAARLKVPKNTAIRPVLIYAGEIADSVLDADYFDKVLDVQELLG
jgi:AAA+ ATPase superfamily predicted ATPase